MEAEEERDLVARIRHTPHLPSAFGDASAADAKDARLLTSHGTLYRALDRLENAGLLTSRWEDPAIAGEESRPRRRFYQMTTKGSIALARWNVEAPSAAFPVSLAPVRTWGEAAIPS